MKKLLILFVSIFGLNAFSAELTYMLTDSEYAKTTSGFLNLQDGLEGKTNEIESWSIDTENLLLKRGGYNLRVRKKKKKYEITLEIKNTEKFKEKAFKFDKQSEAVTVDYKKSLVYACDFIHENAPVNFTKNLVANPGQQLIDNSALLNVCEIDKDSSKNPLLVLQERLKSSFKTGKDAGQFKMLSAADLRYVGYNYIKKVDYNQIMLGREKQTVTVEDVTFYEGSNKVKAYYISVEFSLPEGRTDSELNEIIDPIQVDFENALSRLGIRPKNAPAGKSTISFLMHNHQNPEIAKAIKALKTEGQYRILY